MTCMGADLEVEDEVDIVMLEEKWGMELFF
jgi:hypothetical protein